MLNPDHNASPFNAVPPVALVAALAMAGIEIAVEAGARGFVGGPQAVSWRLELLDRFAFSGPLFRWMLEDTSRLTASGLARFVTYPFVHGSFTHMLFAAVITLALGKFVGEVFRPLALVAVWAVAAVAGALAHAALPITLPLYGGMPPAYGLIGALTFILWRRARDRGQPPWPAFRMIGFLVVLQVLFAGIDGAFGPQVVAELTAFVAGFLVSFAVSPGGWQRLTATIRQR
jgi:membrane associated rhomboid family serine protease